MVPVALVIFVLFAALEHGIASQPTPSQVVDRLKMGGIRLMLILIVSFLAGEVVTEAYYDQEVKAEAVEIREQSLDQLAAQIRSDAEQNTEIETLRADRRRARRSVNRAQAELAAAQERVDEVQGLLDAEENGELGGREDGCGEYCDRLKTELDVANATRDGLAADLEEAREGTRTTMAGIAAEISALKDEIEARVDEAKADLRDAQASPSERFEALNRLTWGSGHWDSLLLRLAITVGLMLMEGSAIGLKLGTQSEYDADVIDRRERDVARKEADRKEELYQLHLRVRAVDQRIASDGNAREVDAQAHEISRAARKAVKNDLVKNKADAIVDRARFNERADTLEAKAARVVQIASTLEELRRVLGFDVESDRESETAADDERY